MNIKNSTHPVARLILSKLPLAALSFKELGYDIYNPALWMHSCNFIQSRLSALIDQCMKCKLVAICRGGCIYSGLDKENQINTAACAYQNELWKIYVEKIYKQGASQPHADGHAIN